MADRRAPYLRFAVRTTPRAEAQLRVLPADSVKLLARQLKRIAATAAHTGKDGNTHVHARDCRALCEVDRDQGMILVLDVSGPEGG